MKKSHLMMVGARDARSIRGEDFYETPPEATCALLTVEQFVGPVWEPACGLGAISSVLEDAGHEVVSTDLTDRGYGQARIDFLFERAPRAPNIVTNPPYKLADQFAEHAVNMSSGKVAFLMRLVWLEGQKRKRLFEKTKLSRVWVFSKRIPRMHRHDFDGKPTTSTIAFAWFVWDQSHVGKTVIGWI